MQMKGIISKVFSMLGLAGILALTSGCHRSYRDLVDTCYPERYWHSSHELANQVIAPQVQNGKILDQTVWNYHFEKGSDVLTPGGLEKLAYLARRRPQPDTTLFLQSAQDVTYDHLNPQKMVNDRAVLNQKRVAAIQQYLAAETAGRGLAFQVHVHNPAEVGQPGVPVDNAVRRMYTSTTATLPGGAVVGGGGGAAGQ